MHVYGIRSWTIHHCLEMYPAIMYTSLGNYKRHWHTFVWTWIKVIILMFWLFLHLYSINRRYTRNRPKVSYTKKINRKRKWKSRRERENERIGEREKERKIRGRGEGRELAGGGRMMRSRAIPFPYESGYHEHAAHPSRRTSSSPQVLRSVPSATSGGSADLTC